MSEFKQATYTALIEHQCPMSLAYLAADILDRQNNGELPCPLDEGSYEKSIISQVYPYLVQEPRVEQSYDLSNFEVVEIPRTESGEAARSLALAMSDDELLVWCNQISQRDFQEDFRPDICPWLNGSKDGMIDFIVGSFI